jgi:hypothetical protein
MQVLEVGTPVHYHSEPTWTGTVIKARTVGKGDEVEAKYLIRWDEDIDDEGPTWSWWMEIKTV